MRLSALMEIPAIWIFTHDSIGLGEDGPTHQSIEQLVTLRAVPGMTLLRPGDANEVVESYKVIMKLQHKPAVLVLTRQALPTLDRTKYAPAAGVARGAYILADAEGGKPQVILIGTGSELSLCVDAYEKLKAGWHSRPRRQHAVVGYFRAPGSELPRPGACRRKSRHAWPSKPRQRSVGTNMLAPRAGSSACEASARRPRSRTS